MGAAEIKSQVVEDFVMVEKPGTESADPVSQLTEKLGGLQIEEKKEDQLKDTSMSAEDEGRFSPKMN